MKKNSDGLIVAISALIALALVLVVIVMVISKDKGTEPDETTVAAGTSSAEGSTAEPGTTAPEETSAEPDSSTAEVTTEALTTEEVTTEPVTTEPVTTVEVTTEAVTTEAVTTAAVTTSKPGMPELPEVHEWVPVHIEGSELVGVTSKGYPIEVKDGMTYVAGILIANKTYSLPADFVPAGYTQPATQDVVINTLTKEADQYYQLMKAYFKAENPKATGFKIQSGYRSYETQRRLYTNYVKNQGQAAADTYSARPGHSEHQTGLAADINVVGTYTLYESIKDTFEGKWLAANSWKFGYILRYPQGKTPETGYIFEPWHFRYIGVDAAAAVYQSGLCLEEFLGIDSEYKS